MVEYAAMNEIPSEKADAFIAACRRVAYYGLVGCSSGNLSWRIDADHMLISVSRSWLADMSGEDVALCRIGDGECLNGRIPSAETGFHLGILRERADVSVVLHFQTPFATTVACRSPETVDYAMIPEVPYYIGEIASVPYLHPGSDEVAAAVIEAMRTCDMVMMVNHGQVTVGDSFDDVIQKAYFIELACQAIVLGGDGARAMSDENSAHLRRIAREHGTGATPYR